MAGRMWLANANYGAWVPCPSIEMPSGTQKWGASGQFLNGGAYVRRSITGARVFEMNWPMKHQADLDTVEAFFEGAYGEGPFFVAEPGSMVYNMFPAYLATPGMGVSDGPTLLYDKRPSVAQYESPSGEPIRGAAYSKTVGDMINKFTIAVPEGHTLHTSIDATAGCMMATNMDGSPAYPSEIYEWTGEEGKSTSTLTRASEVLTNLVPNPRGRDTDGTVVVRENLAVNPSFEYGTTGWSAGTNLTITQEVDSAAGVEGDYVAAITPDGVGTPGNALVFSPRAAVTSGETISVMGRVRRDAGTVSAEVRMMVHAYDSGGFHSTLANTTVSTEAGNPAAMNEALLEGLVVPAGVVTVQIAWSLPVGYDASGWTAGALHIDAHMINVGETIGDYFDGDSVNNDPDLTLAWTGTPGESASQLTAPKPAGWLVGTGSAAYYSASRDAVAIRAMADIATAGAGMVLTGLVPGANYTAVVLAQSPDISEVDIDTGSSDPGKVPSPAQGWGTGYTQYSSVAESALPMVSFPDATAGQTVYVRLGFNDGDHRTYFDGDSVNVTGGLAHGIRQWTGGRLLQFHLTPDYIGTAVVYSMCAVAVPGSETFDIEAHVNSGRFPRGKGSAGMEVDGDFERTSYSAALDRYHGSVRLVEVEPWL